MKNKIYLAVLATLLVTSCGLNSAEKNTLPSQSFVKGTIVYNGNTSLPENTQVSVKINDVSLADVSSVTIGEYKTSGVSSFPIPFKIDYLPSKIKKGFSYSVSTRIEKNGKLLFINDTRIPVFQNGNIEKRNIKLPVIKIGRY